MLHSPFSIASVGADAIAPLGYIPHGHCYLWQTPLVGLHIAADALTALAYFSIPATLLYFALRRRDLPFKGLFALFGAFIVLCGLTHVMEIWTLWHPNYWSAGVLKGATALVSVATAATAVPVVPQALALRSPDELEQLNQALTMEIEERRSIEAALHAQNACLEQTLQDLQRAQLQLIQTEKLSSLGQLVAGVAHEINNPVNFIYGNLAHAKIYAEQLLQVVEAYRDRVPQPDYDLQELLENTDLDFLEEDFPKLLASMRGGAERICNIVNSLRIFSRTDDQKVVPYCLQDGLESTLSILRNRLKPQLDRPGIVVTKSYGEIPQIIGYPGPMNQVFMNLLVNAIDALEERDTTRSPEDCHRNPSRIDLRIETAPGDRIRITIADNGPGIPPEIQKCIFDPFFTTKPVGKGTGLGMSISYDVVETKHGGRLTCASAVGQGTTFVVELPRVAQPPAIAPATHQPATQSAIA
ncbi:MAG: ATP-binding protein [Cyanobacteria bacterium]|nr:ATP-binding protein [Cyanobacteriota bacterium]